MGSLAERLAAKIDTNGEHHRWLGAGADGTPQIRHRRPTDDCPPAETTGRFDDLDTLTAAYLNHLESESRTTLTLRRYRQLWNQWLSPTLGASAPDELTRRRLEESLAGMAEAGQSPSSVHQAAVLLSGCLAWARRQGHLGANPALGLRLPDGRTLASPRVR